MSKSPFARVANAEIRFLMPTDRVILDEYDNPTPVVEVLVVKALLKPSGNNLKPQAGADQNQSEFSGYLVDPLELPKTIASGTKAGVAIGDRKGEFTLLPTFPNPYLAAAKIKELTEIKGVVRWLN
jgi:hypothetical protein